MSGAVLERRGHRVEDIPQAIELEQAFLRDFRATGLRWSRYACYATGALVLLFMLVPALSNRFALGAFGIRAAMFGVLCAIGWVLQQRPAIAIANYVLIVGSCSFVMLAGVVAIIAIPTFGAVAVGFSPLPVTLFGLFLNYGFLRLPLPVVSGLCCAFSLAIVIAAPTEFEGAGQVRMFVYLVFVNVLGMLLARSIESRERELFIQRRRAEAAQVELKERARAAEEAHMEKTRLMAAVSHDLRQPMMAAASYMSILRRRLQNRDFEQAQRQLDRLGESVGLLGATLDHLLTAARYESGTEPIRIESVELGPILSRLQATFAAEAANRGTELRVRIPQKRLVVTTDAAALWRVLMNLVSNALKFTDARGRHGRGVVVRATLRAGICRIDVADTGIGIAPEHLKAIWEPYFQVANAERNRERGLGLGLFLVRRALDHLPEHRLSLRSRPGRGSRFSVCLPGLMLGEPEILTHRQTALATEDLEMMRGAHVLVLEDDHEARRALQELLADWGVVYSCGATLEDLLRDMDSSERSVDAIVSDFRLPGGRTGVDCVLELRRLIGSPVAAVIVTGEPDLAPIRARLPSDTVLLQKPFDVGALAIPLVEAIRAARRADGS